MEQIQTERSYEKIMNFLMSFHCWKNGNTCLFNKLTRAYNQTLKKLFEVSDTKIFELSKQCSEKV